MICDNCKKEFVCLDKHLSSSKWCFNYYLKNSKYKDSLFDKKIRKEILDSVSNKDYRKRISENSNKQWADKSSRQKLMESKKVLSTPEFKEQARRITTELWKNKEYREKSVLSHTGKKLSDETKRNMSISAQNYIEENRQRMINRWKDESYKEKLMKYYNSVSHKTFARKNLTSLWLDPKFRLANTTRMKLGGAMKAMSGNTNLSKPQKELFQLVKSLINEDCIVNYPIPEINSLLDIAIPSLKIDLEYDGSYWHQDQKHDDERDSKLRSLGWKIFRFRDRIPTKEEIHKIIKENSDITS